MKITDIATIRQLVKYELGYGDETLGEVLVDDFTNKWGVHNWRNYVDFEYKKVWQSLPEDIRLVIYYVAEMKSDAEEWD